MVLTRGFSLAAAGVVAGTLAALWAGRFVEPLLFDGRTPRDPLAFAVAALVLLTIAVMASLLPAHRASRADPRQALAAGDESGIGSLPRSSHSPPGSRIRMSGSIDFVPPAGVV